MKPKIGVALSGGGIRGLAHLGVLQVLEGAQVPVDAITGTSMGGLIAGLYAAGVPLEEMISFSETVGIVDVAAPDRNWRGFFGHKKLRRLLIELLGRDDVTFAELNIPTAVIATDVETGEMVILDQGLLIPALIATCAFPILFSPVHHRGRWLVDGGVVNNLPVDVVRAMGTDRVIGVSVPQNVQLNAEEKEKAKGLSIQGLRLLGNQTHNWRMPFLIAEASMGFAIQLVNQRRFDLCPPDVLIQVNLLNVGLFENGKSSEVIEAGRQAALKHLPQVSQLMARPQGKPWWARLALLVHRLRRAWAALRQPRYQLYPQGIRCFAPPTQLEYTSSESPDEEGESLHTRQVGELSI